MEEAKKWMLLYKRSLNKIIFFKNDRKAYLLNKFISKYKHFENTL